MSSAIRELVLASPMTRGEICRAVGISSGMLSMIERGGRKPSLDNAVRLADVLGVPITVIRPDYAAIAAAVEKSRPVRKVRRAIPESAA